MPSNIVPAASIVSHCHSSFSRAITTSHFPSSGGKKEDECFDRRKICWNNSIRGSRSVCGKISPDSKMSIIHIIVGYSVKVSSRHLRLQKLDKLLHWECSTIHHEFGDCSFLCPQLQLRYSSTTPKNPCSEQMRLRLRTLVVLS